MYKIQKGMSREKINNVLNGDIELIDDVYLGSDYNHSWKCKCDKVFTRSWRVVKRGSVQCRDCSNMEIESKYKKGVNELGSYDYIRSYRKSDILPNGKKLRRVLILRLGIDIAIIVLL